MGTPSLSPSTEVLPGWRNRELLDRLIAAHRSSPISLRIIIAALASIGAGVALVLAGWVAVRYTAMVESCTEEAAFRRRSPTSPT